VSRKPVYHITTAHQPYDQRVYYKECRSLAGAGHQVYYIVPSADDLESEFVTFRSYSPDRARAGRFLHHGFRVLRELDRIGKPGIVHFHDPELMLFIPALKRRGHQVIYDVHEEYVKQMSHRHWLPPGLRGAMGQVYQWLEDRFLPRVDAVIAATPAIASHYRQYHTVLVQNFPRLQQDYDFDYEQYNQRSSDLLYYGVINEVRGVESVLDAIAQVNSPKEKVRYRLAGVFIPEHYKQHLTQSKGWAYTDFLGYLDQAGIYRELQRARMAAVVLDPVPNQLKSQPNKLFEFMWAGLPIIYSNFDHWNSMAEGCGIAVPPGDPEAVAEAITYLLDHPQEAYEMGQKGRKAVQERFNWPNEETTLLSLYEHLNH
jgi:glycosyltransferase involved in cell wall biosynthesis